ncbi:MAG: hypothetical protein GTO14_19880 [Anaerolineales bacterium]|nr:hypothetical protein [Anaerolineales bacterium]
MTVGRRRSRGNSPFIRIRKNHGLEHATIHILSQRFPKKTFIGRSDTKGFYLFGDLTLETLREAVEEALDRLRRGEHQLAIHPNCGTNLVTSAALAGTASFLSLLGSKDESWRERMERLPLAVAATVLALIAAQPLGRLAQQRLTTIADPGSMEIAKILRIQRGRVRIHRVITRE